MVINILNQHFVYEWENRNGKFQFLDIFYLYIFNTYKHAYIYIHIYGTYGHTHIF